MGVYVRSIVLFLGCLSLAQVGACSPWTRKGTAGLTKLQALAVDHHGYTNARRGLVDQLLGALGGGAKGEKDGSKTVTVTQTSRQTVTVGAAGAAAGGNGTAAVTMTVTVTAAAAEGAAAAPAAAGAAGAPAG